MRQKKTNFIIIKKIIIFILIFSMAVPIGFSIPTPAFAANTKIRQEVNITDAYYYAAANTYSTSSEIVAITDNNYSSPTYYFEVVASTTAATTASVSLVNATSSAIVKTISITGGNTYQRYRSTSFLPNASTTVEYKVVLNNENVGKGIIASRIVVLQDAAIISNTETQIEMGNNETYTSMATSTFASPKYWYYDSTKWNGSPTFYAEVTYANTVLATPAASTTNVWTGAGSYTLIASTTLADVAIWGGGGAGADGNNSGGGAGGGGGAFASSTLSFTIGSTTAIVVGAGGATTGADGGTTTVNVTQIKAAPGWGGKGLTTQIGVGGDVAYSTGTVTKAGGNGGQGRDGTGGGATDEGGGGGGAGGPHGAGENGSNGASGAGGAGGRGDNTLGGTAGASPGGSGGSSTLGGGGGAGGVNQGNGGPGGSYGGGGGGGEGGAGGQGSGANGAVTITARFQTVATTTISLEESDGSGDGFVNWTPVAQIVKQSDYTVSTSTRIRSVAFTPTHGRNYRIAFSEGYNGATHAIYNAKIVVIQTGTPTKIQPQYLLANTKLANNTSLQKFLNYWNPSEWSTTNAYVFQAETANGDSSVVGLNAAEGTQISGSFLSSPDNRATSTALCMPYVGDLDTQATTNSGFVFASRILVDVGGTPSTCGVSSGTRKLILRITRLLNVRLR